VKRTIALFALFAAVALIGCNSVPKFATSEELDNAARTGVIPEDWRPVDKEAARILREAKISGGAL
jgi:hypothetical protein